MYHTRIKTFCSHPVSVPEGGHFLFISNNRTKSASYNVICEINMARLRFPGRPGCRFDRLGVRYGADEARNANDPLTLFVANIHRGLRAFRELVGDSDEVNPNFFTASSQDGRHRSFLR